VCPRDSKQKPVAALILALGRLFSESTFLLAELSNSPETLPWQENESIGPVHRLSPLLETYYAVGLQKMPIQSEQTLNFKWAVKVAQEGLA